MTIFKVNEAERNTILAGLYLLTKQIRESNLDPMASEIMTDGATVKPLTPEEINALDERINTTDETPPSHN